METIILFAPLVGALIAGLTWRAITEAGAQWAATGFALFAAALAWVLWFSFDGELRQSYLMDWLRSGTLDAAIALRLDAVSVQMMVAITNASAFAHLFALGFMDRDKSFDDGLSFRPRFFAYLSLFTFAALLLVVSDGLLQILLGLQLSAVMAYLLINFRTHYKNANQAAIQTFVITLMGHGAMVLGVAGLYLLTDSLQFDDIFDALPELADEPALTVCAALVLLGAMAASAQILFHVWLPAAMEAPAPAAALLSAVFAAGGIFVVWRLDPMFAEVRVVQDAMVWVGAVTAVIAGLAAAAQADIKRTMGLIAVVQLGLIFAILGLGLSDGVHQIAHVQIPLFIALQVLMVLGAGAVTRSMDDSRDMTGFGGLRTKLPVVATAMILAGVIAMGFGFAQAGLGVLLSGPGNVIFASAYLLHPGAFFGLCLGVGLGVFAIWRAVFLCFNGPSRAPEDVFDAIVANPRVMNAVLAGLSLLVVGFAFWQVIRLRAMPGLAGPDWLVWSPFVGVLAGFGLALWFYVLQPGLPKVMVRGAASLHTLLGQGFYVDRAYQSVIVTPIKALGTLFGDKIDHSLDAPFRRLSAHLAPRFSEIVDRRFGPLLLGCAAVVLFGLVAVITWTVLAGGAA
ncbi:MAG: proton-conducting transporter membrane subunit [Pseudomonadota bacterium]